MQSPLIPHVKRAAPDFNSRPPVVNATEARMNSLTTHVNCAAARINPLTTDVNLAVARIDPLATDVEAPHSRCNAETDEVKWVEMRDNRILDPGKRGSTLGKTTRPRVIAFLSATFAARPAASALRQVVSRRRSWKHRTAQ